MSLRALITGAGGFLSVPLASELQAAGYELRLHRRVDGDIRDIATWTGALEGVDAVFHLAAQTSARQAEIDPVTDLRTNAEAILHMMQAASALERPPVVVLSGTDTQTGRLTGIVDDEGCDHPRTLYDQHKRYAEEYIEWGTRRGFIRGVTVRLSTLFGVGSAVKQKDRGVINKMVRRALRGEPLTVYGDGSCLRDFLHVDDAAAAMRFAAEKIDSVCGDHFVVGSGRSVALVEAFTHIAEAVATVSGKQVEVRHVPWPPDALEIDRRSVRLDPSRFHERTGWEPHRSFEEGLEEAARKFSEEEL